MEQKILSVTKPPQPKKVLNFYCPDCREVQLRVYPYSPINFPPDWNDPKKFPSCLKCQYTKARTLFLNTPNGKR